MAVLRIPRPDLVDDILYPQIRKTERAVLEAAERWGFQPIGSGIGTDEAAVLIGVELSHRTLPAVRVRGGPPVDRDRVGSFLGKWTDPGAVTWQGPYVRPDGSLAVETPRELRNFEPMLLTELGQISPGQDLRPLLPKAECHPLAEIDDGEALVQLLGELLAKRLPFLD